MILYPALDLLDERAVRLTHGDYAKVRVYSENPGGVLTSFRAAGATCAHLVDLNGARDPASRQKAKIEPLIKNSQLKIQIGGGVRTVADVAQLLEWGADRVVIGSIAVLDPELGAELMDRFGGARLTLAVDCRVDANNEPFIAIKGWTETSPLKLADLVDRFLPLGLKRILCTDISRDGAAGGPNAGLYRTLAELYPGLEIQASGGVRDLGDLSNLKRARAHSAIVGTALYEKTLDLKEALAAC